MTTIVVVGSAIILAVWAGVRFVKSRRQSSDTGDFGHVSQAWLIEQRSGGRQDRFSS